MTMSTTLNLLNRLFRPADILVVDGTLESDLESVLNGICACNLYHFKEGKVEGKYDVVLVEDGTLDGSTLAKLRKAGPVVLVGHHEKTATKEIVAVMPEVNKDAFVDLFKMLKIKMRTPEISAAIDQVAASA